MKQILHEEQDAHVSMVRSLGEQVCYSLVCFMHQVVYNQKHGLSAVKVAHVWQPLVKNYLWISTKHAYYVVYEPKNEPSLSARRGTDYHARERMFKRQTHDYD